MGRGGKFVGKILSDSVSRKTLDEAEAATKPEFDNVFFAQKYRRRFADRNLAGFEAAFSVYLSAVARDGLDPNENFSEAAYLAENPDVLALVQGGGFLCGFQHWLEAGRAENRVVRPADEDDNFENPVEAEFDCSFFSRKYKHRFAGRNLAGSNLAFSLYSSFVTRDELDPSEGFSESYYRHAHTDVAAAVQAGDFASGFEHWVKSGRKERRETAPALTFDRPASNAGRIVVTHKKYRMGETATLCLPRDEFDNMFGYFDAPFFIAKYGKRFGLADSDDAAEAFRLYLLMVNALKLDPNAAFSEAYYLAHNLDIETAVRDHSLLCGFHHWVQYGRLEKRLFRAQARDEPEPLDPLRMSADQELRFKDLFQYSFYAKYFNIPKSLNADEAFRYFLRFDLMRGVVPVDHNVFDEDFYVSYYADVQLYKKQGSIPSGYYHYVMTGHGENRQAIYNPGVLLKTKLGDSADPVGLSNVAIIEKRLRPVPMVIDAARRKTLNVFVPALDGDIMFGGYIAFLHFLCRLVEAGHVLRFIIREDPFGNRDWFLKGIEQKPRWWNAFSRQELCNATLAKEPISFNQADLCIAYSTWTMFDAWSVSQHLNTRTAIFFVQEYEPIFHENNALNFVMSSAYGLPHLPIFNSSMLAAYFEAYKIGTFATQSNAYLAFEHAVTSLQVKEMPPRAKARVRRLICYARPERHAGRNLFEVCVLALKAAGKQGIFAGEWEFFGVGALGNDYEIEIGEGRRMRIISRMPQADYETFLQSFDVGLSLMWAPHPSVMPFELAKAGVVTVTNEYGQRDREALSRFGHNIVTAAPSIEGIVSGLAEAVQRAEDMPARVQSARFEWPTDWDDVFDAEFLARVFTALHALNADDA